MKIKGDQALASGTIKSTGRANERLPRIFLLLLPLLSAVMWVGGSRSNAYPIGEYFLDYKHGFLKRALVGELLTHLGYLSTTCIHLVEIASVLLAVVISYAVFRRMLSGDASSALFAVFFLCSPACLPHFSVLAAQPDTLLYSLLLLAYACLCRIPSTSFAPLVALIPCVVALLIHEAFPLLFYNVILIMLWDGWRRGRFSSVAVTAHIVLFAAAFLAVLHYGKLRVDPATLIRNAQARTDITFDPNIFYILTFDFATQWRILLEHYTPIYLAVVFISITINAPLMVATTIFASRVNRARSKPLPGWVIYFLLLTPLALCFLGHDVLRWLAGGEICLMLFILYLAETQRAEVESKMKTMQGPFFYALLLYGFAIGPLGGASVRLIAQLGELLTGGV